MNTHLIDRSWVFQKVCSSDTTLTVSRVNVWRYGHSDIAQTHKFTVAHGITMMCVKRYEYTSWSSRLQNVLFTCLYVLRTRGGIRPQMSTWPEESKLHWFWRAAAFCLDWLSTSKLFYPALTDTTRRAYIHLQPCRPDPICLQHCRSIWKLPTSQSWKNDPKTTAHGTSPWTRVNTQIWALVRMNTSDMIMGFAHYHPTSTTTKRVRRVYVMRCILADHPNVTVGPATQMASDSCSNSALTRPS